MLNIHGNLPALKAVLRDVAHPQVDAIVNLGDSLSGPLKPAETVAFLMEQPWVQLAGNHERQLLDFAPERRGPSDRYTHSQLSSGTYAQRKPDIFGSPVTRVLAMNSRRPCRGCDHRQRSGTPLVRPLLRAGAYVPHRAFRRAVPGRDEVSRGAGRSLRMRRA